MKLSLFTTQSQDSGREVRTPDFIMEICSVSTLPNTQITCIYTHPVLLCAIIGDLLSFQLSPHDNWNPILFYLLDWIYYFLFYCVFNPSLWNESFLWWFLNIIKSLSLPNKTKPFFLFPTLSLSSILGEGVFSIIGALLFHGSICHLPLFI